jgi:hypothetical protein
MCRSSAQSVHAICAGWSGGIGRGLLLPAAVSAVTNGPQRLHRQGLQPRLDTNQVSLVTTHMCAHPAPALPRRQQNRNWVQCKSFYNACIHIVMPAHHETAKSNLTQVYY